MKTPVTIKEIFPKANGIFAHIDFDFGVSKTLLDVMWLGRYGKKNPSPEVEIVHDSVREVLSDEELTLLGQMILALYLNKWTKLKAIPELEYDPIHNYLDRWEDHSAGWDKKDDSVIMQRTDTFGKSVSGDRTDTFGKSVSENRTDTFGKTVATNGTRTDNLMETETINETEQGSDSQADNVFGFNSASAVGSDTSSGSNSKTNTGSNSVANTGTQQNAQNVTEGGTEGRVDTQTESGTQGRLETTTESGTQGRSETTTDNYAGSDNRDRNGEHIGNIGNLTSQKMIGEEIELWKWNFINMVLEDVRDFCTLPIYRR